MQHISSCLLPNLHIVFPLPQLMYASYYTCAFLSSLKWNWIWKKEEESNKRADSHYIRVKDAILFGAFHINGRCYTKKSKRNLAEPVNLIATSTDQTRRRKEQKKSFFQQNALLISITKCCFLSFFFFFLPPQRISNKRREKLNKFSLIEDL